MWAKYILMQSLDHSKWCKWTVVVLFDQQIKFRVIFINNVLPNTDSVLCSLANIIYSLVLLYKLNEIGFPHVWISSSSRCFSSAILFLLIFSVEGLQRVHVRMYVRRVVMMLVTFCTKLYLRSCHRTTKYLPTYVNSSMDLDKVSFVDVRTYVRPFVHLCEVWVFWDI